jgi:hypothetical protein
MNMQAMKEKIDSLDPKLHKALRDALTKQYNRLAGEARELQLQGEPALDLLEKREDRQNGKPPSTAPPAWVAQRLEKALVQKREELALRKRNLASPYYAADEWTKQQITYLKAHITEIERYLNRGGELKLPRCCRQSKHICLIAMRGFDACVMTPDGCGFSLRFLV